MSDVFTVWFLKIQNRLLRIGFRHLAAGSQYCVFLRSSGWPGDGDYGVLCAKLEEILLYIINVLVASLRDTESQKNFYSKINRIVLSAVFPPFT